MKRTLKDIVNFWIFWKNMSLVFYTVITTDPHKNTVIELYNYIK